MFGNDKSFDGRVVWVTGASGGIGRAVALELADRGARLALSARSVDDLEDVADASAADDTLVAPLDVTESERHAETVERIVDHFGALDVAFFNAGVFGTLDGEAFDAEAVCWNIEVNYKGVVHGIEAALPHLRDSDAGHVVGMSSAAAYSPMPRGSGYGASKAAVKYLFDSLAHEWNDKGVDVDVSVVCPGVVRTAMTEDDSFPYERPPALFEATPEWAAEYIVDRMERGTYEIRFPRLFALGLKLLGSIPNPLHRWLLGLASKGQVKSGH